MILQWWIDSFWVSDLPKCWFTFSIKSQPDAEMIFIISDSLRTLWHRLALVLATYVGNVCLLFWYLFSNMQKPFSFSDKPKDQKNWVQHSFSELVPSGDLPGGDTPLLVFGIPLHLPCFPENRHVVTCSPLPSEKNKTPNFYMDSS